MPSARALEMISAGIGDASEARARAKNRQEQATLGQADIRKLLTIAAHESGDTAALGGTKLEQLGRAEAELQKLARINKVTPLEMRNVLRETPEVTEEIFTEIAAGRIDPTGALENTALAMEQVSDDVKAAAEPGAAAAVEGALTGTSPVEIPDAALKKLFETVKAFGSESDTEPTLKMLSSALSLSRAGQYALASALLATD